MRPWILLCLFAILSVYNPLLGQSQWRIAVSPHSTEIAGIDIFHSNPETLFAIGSVQSGPYTRFLAVFRSTDRGERWDSLLRGIGAAYGAIRVDPQNSNLLYASHYGLEWNTNDISLSRDGGQSWERTFGGSDCEAPIIEIDPIDHKTVYVAVGPGVFHCTTDQGVTWNNLNGLGVIGYPTSLKVAPSNDSIIYIASLYGVFKSTDKGSTKQQLSVGIGVNTWKQVVVHPRDPDIIYVSIYNSIDTLPGGVFKSTDGGVNWSENVCLQNLLDTLWLKLMDSFSDNQVVNS